MLVILPRPKFSFKWEIDVLDAPNQWKALVENSIVWTLAQEKRYRDRYMGASVKFISKPYMEKIIKKAAAKEIDGIVVDDLFVVFLEPVRDSNRNAYLGEIVCSASMIYERTEKDKHNLFSFVIQSFIKAAMQFLKLEVREEQSLYRRVLSKFSLS